MPRCHDQGSNARNNAQYFSHPDFLPHRDSCIDTIDPFDELKREMGNLMDERLESLRKQAFVPPDEKQIEADVNRLKRIREVSTDYLAALKRSHAQNGNESMTDKPSVKLPGKVEKVIKPAAGEPEKAQIAIEGADPLYREIRIENKLVDVEGEVHLKQDDEVEVTVEAEKASHEPQDQNNGKERTKANTSGSQERKAS